MTLNRVSPHDSMSPGTDDEERLLDQLFDELYPICRSITGPGLRESLEILGRHLPFKICAVKSGTQIYDWTVPREWRINGARLTGPDGHIYADFAEHNLHVVNYSSPVDGKFTREELQPHLHSMADQPDAIPYVFSYYNENWGFCLAHNVRKKMTPGRYHAVIDSEFMQGELNYAECVLEGETDREILLSSYLCHPSLANNELSGPLTLVALYNRLSKWKRRRYTYRFLLNPETIGSLCYLAANGDDLRERLVGGLVLTCLGGPHRALSYKMSRHGDSLLDLTARWMQTRDPATLEIRDFTPTDGSDERQYCAPGFNLPVGQMARTVYGEYTEYHTSRDDKAFMGIKPLVQSASKIEHFLRKVESGGVFINLKPHGEPQLGKYGLYPLLNSPNDWKKSNESEQQDRGFLNRVLYVLNYSDGWHTMFDVAEICGVSVEELEPVIEALEHAGLLRLKLRDDEAL